jgi:hypothetical protein
MADLVRHKKRTLSIINLSIGDHWLHMSQMW